MDDRAEFLARYHEELTYLREAGQSFGREHPKLAGRLELSRDGSADPHVERLIESFAFLTARIQRRFDADFPEFTSALLGELYPNLVNPIPPMTVAQVVADPARGKLTAGYTMPRHTKLFATTAEGLTCRFRTAYPLTLWPLEVMDAGFVSKARYDFLEHDRNIFSVLRLRIDSRGAAFSDLELKQLRFHVSGPSYVTSHIYELLLSHCVSVVLRDRVTGRSVILPASSVQPVGFSEDEEVIPYSSRSHPAYRLVQEYFWLPEKFLFFDLSGLDRNPSIVDLEILFLLDTPLKERLMVTRENFRLGCTPVINLFPRTSEPIRIDHTATEYRLIPDARRERTTEIHSILSVSSSSNPQETSRHLRSFYSAEGTSSSDDAFWVARRVLSERDELTGTDVYLSFVDLAFKPSRPPRETAFAHLLCTNRDLASQLPENALLQTEDPGPIAYIRCLGRPTPTGYPPLGGSSRWALISSLTLNTLSLTEGSSSLEAFRRILGLYSLSGSAVAQKQINGIRAMSTRTIARRLSGKAQGSVAPWQRFHQGYQVTLTIDENVFAGSSSFLFSRVLREFFSLYAGINSFAELAITGDDASCHPIGNPPRGGGPTGGDTG